MELGRLLYCCDRLPRGTEERSVLADTGHCRCQLESSLAQDHPQSGQLLTAFFPGLHRNTRSSLVPLASVQVAGWLTLTPHTAPRPGPTCGLHKQGWILWILGREGKSPFILLLLPPPREYSPVQAARSLPS